jgi:RND family efflux transporter MFP subunit
VEQRHSNRFGAVTFIALLAIGCGDEVVEQAPVVRPVKMFVFGGAGLGAGVEYSGVVKAARNVEMSFEVPGRILEFPVVEGQRVQFGTLLARLDARDFVARRDAAAAETNAAEADYIRYQELYAADAVSLQELEVRRRNFEVAAANSRTAEKSVADTYLRAPFTGQVALTIVDDLEQVQARQPILVFHDDSGLEVEVNIPETDAIRGAVYLSNPDAMARLSPTVQISSLPDRSFEARLSEFATTADPITRTFAATFTFAPPEDGSIRPGMTASLVIEQDDDAPPGAAGGVAGGAALIPVGAVLGDSEGSAFVWRVDRSSMTVTRAGVEVGAVTGDQIQLLSGLSPADLIVTTGVNNLRDGMQVRELHDPSSD